MAKIKSAAAIKEQVSKGLTCRAPGCNEPLTMFKGIGEDCCRVHQMSLRENGGLARADRPYTFHKKWCCDWCDYDPREDKRFNRMTNLIQKDRAMRATLICDHIIRKADGGTDEESNIQTLCQICDKIKSSEEDDWTRAAEVDRLDE